MKVTDQISDASGSVVFTDTDGGVVNGDTVTFATLAQGEVRTILVSYTVVEADAGHSIPFSRANGATGQ